MAYKFIMIGVLLFLRFSAMARQVSTAAVTSKINTGLKQVKGAIEMSLTSDIMDLEDYNDTLAEKLSELQQQLIDVETRSSKMEQAIREEVAEEMAEQMIALEQGYQHAAAHQANATEAKFEKKQELYTHSVARLPARSRIDKKATVDKDVHADLQQQYATLERESNKLGKEVATTKTLLAQCTEELEQKTAQYNKLLEEMKFLEVGALDMQESLDVSAERIAEMESRYTRLKEDYNSIKKETSHSQDTLQREMDLLRENTVEASTKHQNALEGQVQSLAGTHAEEITTMASKYAAEMENTKEEFLEKLRDLETRSSNAEASLEQKDRAVQELQKQTTELQRQHVDKADKESSLIERLANLENENTDLKKQRDLTEQRGQLTIKGLERKIRSHQDTIATLNVTSADHEAKNNQLQAKLAGLLSEHMDDDVMKFVTTPAGAKLSRLGSVVSSDGHFLSAHTNPNAPNTVMIKVSPRKSPAARSVRENTQSHTIQVDPEITEKPKLRRPKPAQHTASTAEINASPVNKRTSVRLSTINLNILATPDAGSTLEEPVTIDVNTLQKQGRAKTATRKASQSNAMSKTSRTRSSIMQIDEESLPKQESSFTPQGSGKRKTASKTNMFAEKENAQTPASTRKVHTPSLPPPPHPPTHTPLCTALALQIKSPSRFAASLSPFRPL